MTRSLQEHLARGGRKRMLAIDGGGARGILALGILKRIETLLAERLPVDRRPHFRLHHYYDLIGGTSTGAILAAGLSIGLSVDDLRKFYFDLCPKIFRPRRTLAVGAPRFDSGLLERELHRVLRETDGQPKDIPLGRGKEVGEPIKLSSQAIRTGLAVFAKRIDTGGAWTLTNNPDWAYYDQEAQKRYAASIDAKPDVFSDNKNLPLSRLVMASAAAPTYFENVGLNVEAAKASGKMGVQVDGIEDATFVDGGLGGRNTPALQMLVMATHPVYGYEWETGEDKLLVTSVGTGWWRPRVTDAIVSADMPFGPLKPAYNAISCLQSMIHDTSLNALMVLQSLSRTPEEPQKRWWIDGELRDMEGYMLSAEPLLRFRRMDVRLDGKHLNELLPHGLEEEVLAQGLSVRLTQRDLKDAGAWGENEVIMRLRNLGEADLDVLKLNYLLGGKYAQGYVDHDDFPREFDPPGMFAPDAADTVGVVADTASKLGRQVEAIEESLREGEDPAAKALGAPPPAAATAEPPPPVTPAPAAPAAPMAEPVFVVSEEARRRAPFIARAVHELIRSWQIELGQTPVEHWEAATEAERVSSIDAVTFRLDNLDAPASAQHEQWMSHKLADGWRLGEVKDAEAKTHPMLRPYDELPADERKKDAMIAGLVRSLAAALD